MTSRACRSLSVPITDAIAATCQLGVGSCIVSTPPENRPLVIERRPLSVVKQTWLFALQMSANDP